MTSGEKKSLYISLLLAFTTGAFIFFLDNFFEIEKPWGVESSPYLSIAKMFHYLTTPLLVLSIGFILKGHILKKFKNLNYEKRKTTGVSTALLMFLLIYSGQSILFLTHEVIKEYTGYFHTFCGVLVCVVIIKHTRIKN